MAKRIVCNECLKSGIVRPASVVNVTMEIVGKDGDVREVRETKSLCDECITPALELARLLALPAHAGARPERPGAAVGKHRLRPADFNTAVGQAMLAAMAAQGLRQL